VYEPAFMQQAIALSAQALSTPDTERFGAVVVKDGKVIGKGFNLETAVDRLLLCLERCHE
jgi:guanine deaminase